jgi:tetratricopeptide (TPR) repeat protein
VRALSIREQRLGSEHPETAVSLSNLALLYQRQGKYAQAERLLQCACLISELALGATHPEMAVSLNNLAGLYYDQGKYMKAKPFYQRALAISERALGREHPQTQGFRENYRLLLRRMEHKTKRTI